MSRIASILLVVSAFAASVAAQDIPVQLRGRWVVTRVLPTTAISCWGSDDAKKLVGTEIEYTADSLRWKNYVAYHPKAEVTLMSAERFHAENSDWGSSRSEVTFGQLGIGGGSATQIVLVHPDAPPVPGANEIPGDRVLIKGGGTIVVSVCNVFFEARRAGPEDKPAH
jgi:hypothetical protein